LSKVLATDRRRGASGASTLDDGSRRSRSPANSGQTIPRIHETPLRGRDIGLVVSYLCYHSIEAGDLVHLLPEWTRVPEAGFYVAYSSSKRLAPKVRVFSDFLVQKLNNVPW
jgi:DNA-binding transcriptional LysR family regulator